MKCPNCNHEIPRDSTRLTSQILSGFLKECDGTEGLAKDLATWFQNTKADKHRAGPMFRTLLEMIQNEDKLQIHQNFTEDVAEAHERGYVIEYALSDIDVLHTINRMAIERGMSPLSNVIEAEYARIE